MRHKCQIFLFGILILFLFDSNVYAGGGVMWQENGVLVCDSTRSGGIIAVPDGKGGAIIGWRDDRNNYSIYAQRVDPDGNMLWDINGVPVCNDGTVYMEPDISCVSDGRGGAIFTWVDFINIVDSTYYNVFVQRIDSMGVCHWVTNGIKVAYTDSSQRYPSIVSDGVGGCIVAWEDYRNGNTDVYAQRVDSSGNLIWNNSGVAICVAAGPQYRPQIASDGAEGAVITWEDQRVGDWQIYAQRISSSGVQLWEFNGLPLCTLMSTQPSIINVNNNFIVSWNDFRNGNKDVYAQKVGLDGLLQWIDNGTPICVMDSTQGGTSIIDDIVDGVIIKWWDYRNGNRDIFAQRVDSSGTLLWDSIGVAICELDSNQEYHTMISDDISGAIVAWMDYRSSNWDIYCQRVDSSGILQWGAGGLPVCVEPSYQGHPEIISDGEGGAIISWADNRNSGCVYAQRVGDVEGVEEGRRKGRREKREEGFLSTHPNPFTTVTTITFTLPSAQGHKSTGEQGETIELKIYDVTGRLVKRFTIDDSRFTEITWEGKNENGEKVNTGIYFVIVKSKTLNIDKTEKIIMIR